MSKWSKEQRREMRRRRAAKRREKREKRRRKERPLSRRSPYSLLRSSGDWPLHECLLTEEWQEEGAIVQILVARRSPAGQIATGTFLVDLGCLGVKSAFASLFNNRREYEQKLRARVTSRQEMIEADLNLAAKIIREAIAYAKDLGFKPDPDYRDAILVLGDADPDACDVPIPLGGPEAKPLFIAGPYDDVDRIMAQLTRKLGPGGFHYLVPISGDTEVFLPDE